ncbi:Bardet-Biedl syndrome 4 protein homolog [Pectinophora gossypiella]|uniref:Bardet-Biedl syndrome 4 protein homolog n=1 Tax=Pectinophora gossypiella TaxID=13191 RepID=UPI00214EB0D3|nr:Bardet-Biedl syndrome 4 protein homolog [Pectinophora gossypiella]
MRKHTLNSEKLFDNELGRGSRNWLLHARYVRGEHALCLELADELQKKTDNTHRYAHFIKGSVLADAGRLQEALERFHNCIRLQPQDPEPLKQVAKCLFKQGRFQLSLEAYLEADKLTKHPDPDIYCALAECAWKLGSVERGVEWARSAWQAGGGERAASLLARLLLAAGDRAAALAAYDQALTAHACGADTLAAAGALRLRAGDPRRAFQLLGAALAQQPTQHAAALALAAMMLQHKDTDAALARLKAALAAHPTCVAAHTNLGLALLAKKKYIAALTCLQRAVWTAPLSARAAHNLGLALLMCKRPTSAFCRFAAAAAAQPTQPYTVLLIGVALERLGDARADAAYARAAELAPQDALVRLNLAGRHARAGRLVAAATDAEHTAGLLDPERPDPQLSSSLATLLGLLRDAGLELSKLPETFNTEGSAVTERSNNEEQNFEPDELAEAANDKPERTASLVVLPPIILGYDDLYDDVKTTPTEASTAQTKMRAQSAEKTFPANLEKDVINSILLQYLKNNLRQASKINSTAAPTTTTNTTTKQPKDDHLEDHKLDHLEIHRDVQHPGLIRQLIQAGNIPLMAKGHVKEPNDDEALHFQGKFVLPDKLFDCPCGNHGLKEGNNTRSRHEGKVYEIKENTSYHARRGRDSKT